MTLELHIPDSIPLDSRVTVEFLAFLQAVVNRRCVGALRYGDRPTKRRRYMTRLSRELRAYRRDGNAEQLFNIAVYAFLESAAPENKKLHWDATVDSVTRKEFGLGARVNALDAGTAHVLASSEGLPTDTGSVQGGRD